MQPYRLTDANQGEFSVQVAGLGIDDGVESDACQDQANIRIQLSAPLTIEAFRERAKDPLVPSITLQMNTNPTTDAGRHQAALTQEVIGQMCVKPRIRRLLPVKSPDRVPQIRIIVAQVGEEVFFLINDGVDDTTFWTTERSLSNGEVHVGAFISDFRDTQFRSATLLEYKMGKHLIQVIRNELSNQALGVVGWDVHVGSPRSNLMILHPEFLVSLGNYCIQRSILLEEDFSVKNFIGKEVTMRARILMSLIRPEGYPGNTDYPEGMTSRNRWRIALVSPHTLLLIDCLMSSTYVLRRDQMDDPNFNCGQWIQEKKQMNPVSKVNAQGELNNTDRIVLALTLTKLPAELASIEDYIGLQDVVAQLFGLPSLQAQILAATLVPESKWKAGPKLKAKPEFKPATGKSMMCSKNSLGLQL
ncbi:hypothetical protein FRB99_008948 [Tulasnella sp. 403]|nr:hypothetical protein FRB99_008948 [Tulasnella sp. 403]